MTYYQKLAVTAMLKTLSMVSVMICVTEVFNWDKTTARTNVKYAEENLRISDSRMLVERMGDDFYLLTGDRTIYVTEGFLSECASDHAKAVRAAMEEMSK
jgi:hypothetical protein